MRKVAKLLGDLNKIDFKKFFFKKLLVCICG